MAKIRMRQAISLAMEHEMAADSSVVFFGEDVAAAGGVFKTSEGLLDQFGPGQVRDTPISEMGFLGAGVGAAMTGLRPIVEIMFMDFLGVALDQLVTQAAKMRFLSAGQYHVPLVVRGSAGAGLGFAAQHSQSVEPWVLATPGLKVAVPSGPAAAYGLLRAAIRDDDPVLLIEPRILYGVREDFDPQATSYPLGRGRVVRPGTEITVVALGAGVTTATAAFETDDSRAEVIDLLSLSPWDKDLVSESVSRTGRLAIVEEGPLTGGWGSTIAAHVGSHCFGRLRAPVLRITGPDAPVPYAEKLEALTVPSPDYVRTQIEYLLKTGELPLAWWEHNDN